MDTNRASPTPPSAASDLDKLEVAARHIIAECRAAPPYVEPLLYINAEVQLALVRSARELAAVWAELERHELKSVGGWTESEHLRDLLTRNSRYAKNLRDAALGVLELYAGSYGGFPILMDTIGDKPVVGRERFEALARAVGYDKWPPVGPSSPRAAQSPPAGTE